MLRRFRRVQASQTHTMRPRSCPEDQPSGGGTLDAGWPHRWQYTCSLT